MKIVHEIDYPTQSTGGIDYFYPDKDGFRVSLLSCHAPGPGTFSPTRKKESIYIEGDARHILCMLQSLMDIVAMLAEVNVKEGNLDASWAKAKTRED